MAPIPLPPPLHRFSLMAGLALDKDPVGYVGKLSAQGPLAQAKLPGLPVLLVSDPDLIREVLLTRAGELEKSKPLPRVKLLLGEGIFTTEGETHRRHRRLVMPAFHRQIIGKHAALMVERTKALMAGWQDGQELNLHAMLSDLSLDIASRALFGTDLGPAQLRIQQSMAVITKHFNISAPPWLDRLKLRLPLASTKATKGAVADLEGVVAEVLERRRREPGGHQDLLQMLLEARDEDGQALNDRELRDEALTLLLASHDTMATALTWTLGLLVQQPQHQVALQKGLAETLAGREPGGQDYAALAFVERVFAEGLRLFPPGWLLARTPKGPFSLGGHAVAMGTFIVISPYWVHRDPKNFPDPDRFDPERFQPAAKEGRRPFTYLPFSAGPRSCLGEGFAWMEGVLILATLFQRCSFQAPAGQPLVLKPAAKFLLTPDRPLRVTLKML
jgi:cytochrome P450